VVKRPESLDERVQETGPDDFTVELFSVADELHPEEFPHYLFSVHGIPLSRSNITRGFASSVKKIVPWRFARHEATP